jgi:2-phosphosulfolactate phosphatase
MKIEVFFTPFFPETELMFSDSYVVMLDIFRASTTVCSILNNRAKEIIYCETIEKAINIFSSLSKEYRVLGGERNGLRPDGFSAGNSPSEYNESLVQSKTVVFSTSNGTKIFSKAKDSKRKFVGAFVNLHALLNVLITDYKESKYNNLVFLCAGNKGRFSAEDSLCAGAYIFNLKKELIELSMTDSAQSALDLFTLYSENLNDYLRSCEHAKLLIKIGLENDVVDCLKFDSIPIVPVISNGSIKLLN